MVKEIFVKRKHRKRDEIRHDLLALIAQVKKHLKGIEEKDKRQINRFIAHLSLKY